MPSSQRLVVIRGDLYSDSGYARATRALGVLLARQARRVVGVSLHEHRSRRQTAIVFPLVSDDELRTNAAFRGAFVINICLPDTFIRVSGAVNIGYFFWETERLPPAGFWTAGLLKMDRLWAPSRWQRDILQKLTGRADIPVVPWPLDESRSESDGDITALAATRVHRAMTQGELDNYLLRATPLDARMLEKDLEEAEHRRGCSSRFDPGHCLTYGEILARDGDLFVAVQTDAPRKGLPLLFVNWLQFKASDEGRDAKLVVKLSSLDVSADLFRLHFHASLAVHKACARCRVAEPDIWFLYDRLSADDMRALLRSADAVVSATLGEGFGGPVAEALIEGTPVITPRHTSIQDLLEETYPLAVRSKHVHLKLWNNIDVYSDASLWHIVDDDSFLVCLKTFARMPRKERLEIADTARVALLKRVGVESVEAVLRREFDLCDALVLDTDARAVPNATDGVRKGSVVFEHEDATA